MSERERSGRAAFTALEVMFALAILAVVILGLMVVLSSSAAVRQQDREVALAMRELSRRMEQYRGMTPNAVISAIDAASPPGMTAVETTGVGTDESGDVILRDVQLTVTVLSEAQVATEMGLGTTPDLDGNGDANSSVYTQYSVAPVRFEIRWTTAGNVQQTRSAITIYYPQTTVGS